MLRHLPNKCCVFGKRTLYSNLPIGKVEYLKPESILNRHGYRRISQNITAIILKIILIKFTIYPDD